MMFQAAMHSVSHAIALRSAVDVCSFVEALPADASGELLFAGRGAAPEGAVFVENRRICWAAARGLSRRLSDLLAESARLDAAGMEAVYSACKRKRAPLGEYLVKAGLISAPDLRCALLRHSTESLHALCGTMDASAEWLARRSGGYNPQFTFTTAEVLSRTLAEDHLALAERAAAELHEAFDDRDWGVAFVRSPSRAAPDPIVVHGAYPDKIGTLLRLGRWACSSLDVTSPLQDEHTFVATVLEDRALVAWRCGSAIIAGATNLHGPARLLNRRARARRRDVPHGSL